MVTDIIRNRSAHVSSSKIPFLFFIFLLSFVSAAFSSSLNKFAPLEESAPVDQPANQTLSNQAELNGDSVEYSMDGNKITAKGNVVIIYQGMTMTCDKVEFSRDTKNAHAEGHVILKTSKGEIRGDNLTFNFYSRTGQFNEAHLIASPYYGYGQKVEKVSDDEIKMSQGYVTTCDHDKPHYRLMSKRVEVYPGKKLVGRQVKMVIGNMPLIYIPKFTQRLDDNKPILTFIPAYTKDWGATLLTTYRYYFNDNLKGNLHLDVREKRGIASGFDVFYNTVKMGAGVIKTYYMDERKIQTKHYFGGDPLLKPIYRERFKVEWRHKWEVDKNTNAILQYYRLSDDAVIKDYFRKQYQQDLSPDTFFLLTRSLTAGTLSFRADGRVNRFEAGLERLPEISYDLPDHRLGDTKFYFKNTTTYSNLAFKEASPTEVRRETMRFDTDNQVSYQTKLGIFELQPFVGERETYYSKTLNPDKYDSIRGIFRTGANLSTKFYRIYDVDSNNFGIPIHRLRHVFSPSIAYLYQHEPTLSKTYLDNFDFIDTLDRSHGLTFSFENKLQTKRDDQTVDLARMVVSTDYLLKEDPNDSGFNKIKANFDIKPVNWLTLYFDSTYDTRRDLLNTANVDLYVKNGEKWSFSLGKRFENNVDDQITSEITYKINPKWKFKVYERFDTDSGTQKEQDFVITRDLHEWEMDLNFNETRGEGSEIMLIFRLKAFPDMAIDLGSGFNKRKAGSQSSEGL